ncbi:MAG: membrane-bound serine protease (ClpP class) [Methyloprofundus sp.]|nr:MAG: membrane-bound serine protease (ClpP class) [Methyloprofundus sp.]
MKKTDQLRKPKIYQKNLLQKGLFSSRGLLLYILPLPLIPAAIISFMYGDLLRIITNLSACASFLFAASLLRHGLAAEIEYQEKKITQPPKWPLKMFAAIIVALSTFAVTWIAAGNSFFVAIAFGLGALAGMLLHYGTDPHKEKMIAGSHGYTAAEIAQTIDEAETQIFGIEQANKQINNPKFNQRIRIICEHAHEILSMLQEDPGDIRRSRKFLNIYLDGALKVTEGFADMQRKQQSEQLAENFDNVLKTIESVFIEQKQKLLEDDILDLDVQIEVLATQLKNEGVI